MSPTPPSRPSADPALTPEVTAYDHPLWYERAFSWRRMASEARWLLSLAKRYAQRPVNDIGELFAGPAPHAKHFTRHGLCYYGVDHNPHMVRYATEQQPELRMFCQDALKPRGLPPCDFLLCLLGSLCVTHAASARAHFRHAARIVRPGGLYALEWCVMNGGPALLHDHWRVSGKDFQLSADYSCVPDLDGDGQHYHERLLICGEDRSGRQRLVQRQRAWAMDQAFLRRHCEQSGLWTLIGTWDQWDLNLPLADADPGRRPITLLLRQEAST